LVLVDNDNRVAIEAERGAILAADGLFGANDYSTNDIAFFDGAARRSFLHICGDDITDLRSGGGLADDTDHGGHAGASIVGDIEAGADLDHGFKLVLKNFDETPALGFAERPGFHDAHAIPDLGFVLLVVGMEFGDMLRDFPELRVRNACHGADDDGFIHFIGYDLADADLTEWAGFGVFGSDCFCHGWLFLGCLGSLAAEDGFDAGDVATRHSDEVWFLELTALLLDAEVENLLLQLALAGE